MSDPIIGYMLGEFAILVAAALVLYAVLSSIVRRVSNSDADVRTKERQAEELTAAEKALVPPTEGWREYGVHERKA
jgi:hypothetical protein